MGGEFLGELNFEGMALLGKTKLFENKILEDRGGEVLCDGKMPGRFCVSLVAAVVGNSFCVATSKIRKAWAALLYSIGGWLRGCFATFSAT